jgi:radical SAM superfamily enzyme YgiQ (UPF0313 family)
MPSRILLISANRCTVPDPVFPLGLAYLSAALRQAGHECAWFDCLTQDSRLEERLDAFRPDFVGISLRNIDDVLIRKQQTFFGELSSLREQIRRKSDCPIILGGSGFSLFPKQLLELSGADFGIVGEGETSLPALLSALEQGSNYERIPGLVFRKHGAISVNTPCASPFEGELSTADRPAEVAAHYLGTSGVLNLQTQRGCSFRCSYCTYPLVEGRQHRRRPPELLAEELAQLQRLGAKYVFVVDSTFNSSPRHVTEVCEAILRRNLKLSWGCFLRPQGLTPELMKLMARAGLAHIEFGADSFSDQVLAACHKDLTFGDIQHSNELARQANIEACHFLIVGGPGETEATLDESFQNSAHLQGAVVMAVVGMRIYPGTHLFEQAVAEGAIERNVDLLNPLYYLAPGLTSESLFERLLGFARLAPNWIAGDPAPAYTSLVQRMRRRGVAGPLWSYFSMMQRLWPQGLPGTAAP